MKFIDLVKEPSDDKLLKKAKTIFSALRKGKITRSDGVSFSYELGGRTHARVYEGEIELIGSVISIKENTYCPINERYMTELIENKFKMFGINVELRPPTEDQIEKYKGKKPWEEPLNEEIDEYTQKQIKKARTIYKALRRGTIGGDNPEEPHFTYVLSDDFSVDINNAGILIFTNEVKIKQLNRSCDRYSNNYVMDLIRKRFEPFGITLSITSYYMDFKVEPWESPINEGAEILNPESLTKNEVRKVKTLYKLLKKGHFKYDDARSTYGYILPDNYYIYKDELGDVCIKLTGEEETKMVSKIKMARPSDNFDIPIQPKYDFLHGWVKNKVIEKFEGFNIKFIF